MRGEVCRFVRTLLPPTDTPNSLHFSLSSVTVFFMSSFLPMMESAVGESGPENLVAFLHTTIFPFLDLIIATLQAESCFCRSKSPA